jgi:hypothetical protein
MKDYYVVLHGAKKNIGDFFIRDRAKKLLTFLRPDRELVEFSSWESLDEHIDIINQSKALIIMGGPGASSCFYPKGYPLLSDINNLKVPFVLLGSGSYEKVYGNLFKKKFNFCLKTKKILSKEYFISTRDDFSNGLFIDNSISSVMTGCPAFYNLDCIDKSLCITSNKKIVFTPPANMLFKKQSINLMIKLRKLFPKYDIYCSFNRGYTADKHTTKEFECSIKGIVDKAKELNFIVSDTSYDLNKLDYYNECDFHVGYRLHSHIHFLSRRAPSFLISEDSRSYGHMKTLGLRIFRGERGNFYSFFYSFGNRYINYFINRYSSPIQENTEHVIDELTSYIDKEVRNDFASFSKIPNKIDCLYKSKMKPYIESLP